MRDAGCGEENGATVHPDRQLAKPEDYGREAIWATPTWWRRLSIKELIGILFGELSGWADFAPVAAGKHVAQSSSCSFCLLLKSRDDIRMLGSDIFILTDVVFEIDEPWPDFQSVVVHRFAVATAGTTAERGCFV